MNFFSTGFFADLKGYNLAKTKGDLMAGLTVAVMLVPQGMAYAMLAGLPPIYGLYAGLVPLLVYPFLGTSKQLSVGPVALVSILVLSGLGTLAKPMSPEYINLAILTAFIAGVIQMLLSVFKMGFLVKFLSEPVLKGFTSGAAIIIGFSQVKSILGLEIPRSASLLGTIENVVWHIKETNLYTLSIGVFALVFLLVMKKVWRAFPSALVLVVLGTLVVHWFELANKGVSVVGFVPAGLPSFEIPKWTIADLKMVMPTAIIICLMSFIESLAIAKMIAVKHDNYPIVANRELMALGVSKVIGGLFQAYPTTGSFTRSAINDESGAKTGMAAIFSAIIVGITLLFFSQYLYSLPMTILAAIIITAVLGLIDIEKAKFYYETSKHDFWVMLLTFIATLLMGIQMGVLTGIVLSMGYILYRSSKPNYVVLGYLEDLGVFRNIDRFENAKERDDLLIIRFDSPIYFGNAEYFGEIIWKEIRQKGEKLEYLLLDFSSIPDIDATGLEIMLHLLEDLEKADICLVMTNVQGKVRDRFALAGLTEKIGVENQFLINKDAYTYTLNPHGRSKIKMKHASQTKNGI